MTLGRHCLLNKSDSATSSKPHCNFFINVIHISICVSICFFLAVTHWKRFQSINQLLNSKLKQSQEVWFSMLKIRDSEPNDLAERSDNSTSSNINTTSSPCFLGWTFWKFHGWANKWNILNRWLPIHLQNLVTKLSLILPPKTLGHYPKLGQGQLIFFPDWKRLWLDHFYKNVALFPSLSVPSNLG